MAKREIPEINAGSMADIAFLLLIFFLVTTTMDKDQAYVRDIPKKIEVINEPVEVEERNMLAIKANNKNQLMVRDEMMSDPSKISEKVVEFYRENEKNNDPLNNFPMYSRVNMKQINVEIQRVDAELSNLEAQDADPALITYTESKLMEWEKRKRALQIYGKEDLPEIHFQANIRIEVQTATQYELFAKIQTEIEEGIFELRDEVSKKTFGESYAILKKRMIQDEDPQDRAKMDLLEILYPARIIEVTPKK